MNDNKTIVRWFCVCFIATLIILVSYLCYSMVTFKNSQERIVTEHIKHLVNADSIFCDIKKIILSNDSGTIVNAHVLLAQLQNDSALMRREILLSQAEESNLVALHIDKIDNDYSQIGIWGGILSIIFLIFGFFAIFKIEETKADAKKTLDEVKTQGDNAIVQIRELQSQAVQLNDWVTSNGQKSRELDILITTFNTKKLQAEESLEKINRLFVEVRSKNEQLDTSIIQVRELMGRLASLIDSLNTSTNNVNGSEHE